MKKTIWPTVVAAFLGLALVCGGMAGILSRYGHFSLTLPVKHKSAFSAQALDQFPSRLSAQGNRIVDSQGGEIVFKGLMAPDPARLSLENRFNQEYYLGMAKTGANVIRIPVHPENWVKDPDYLWRYLDPIVAWAGAAQVYVILDWHYIGNVASGAGEQMPDLNRPPKDLTLEFWRQTALYFRDTPNVIFELFNEPQSITSEVWRTNAQEIRAAIRAQGANQLILVGGIDYGKDLSWVHDHPLQDANVAYTSHIYPIHPQSAWQGWFGKTAEEYPVVISEWGFMDSSQDTAQGYLVGSAASYGQPLLAYLADRHLGWVACWYDDEWLPPMFSAGMKGVNSYGEFILEQLKK